MQKCKFWKKCKLYDEGSTTCNVGQMKGNGTAYCGEYRRINNEK